MYVKIHSRIAEFLPKRYETPVEWEGEIDIEGSTPEEINENLFRFFNRVDKGDTERLIQSGYMLPSLSVDDLVTWGGQTYVVRDVGFEKVS